MVLLFHTPGLNTSSFHSSSLFLPRARAKEKEEKNSRAVRKKTIG
jgi:hypothetical protein